MNQELTMNEYPLPQGFPEVWQGKEDVQKIFHSLISHMGDPSEAAAFIFIGIEKHPASLS